MVSNWRFKYSWINGPENSICWWNIVYNIRRACVIVSVFLQLYGHRNEQWNTDNIGQNVTWTNSLTIYFVCICDLKMGKYIIYNIYLVKTSWSNYCKRDSDVINKYVVTTIIFGLNNSLDLVNVQFTWNLLKGGPHVEFHQNYKMKAPVIHLNTW